MKLLKEAMEFYRRRKKEEKERKTMLSEKPNFAMLENFIKKVNENPKLKITVKLHTGAIYELSTFEPRKVRDFEQIDGNEWTIE